MYDLVPITIARDSIGPHLETVLPAYRLHCPANPNTAHDQRGSRRPLGSVVPSEKKTTPERSEAQPQRSVHSAPFIVQYKPAHSNAEHSHEPPAKKRKTSVAHPTRKRKQTLSPDELRASLETKTVDPHLDGDLQNVLQEMYSTMGVDEADKGLNRTPATELPPPKTARQKRRERQRKVEAECKRKHSNTGRQECSNSAPRH